MSGFTLHPRLAADTHPVTELALCQVLLAKDARFPWLILVPQRADLSELTDLDSVERGLLFDEIAAASRALRQLFAPDRINVAAIGNIVGQLHIHVVARTRSDPAWPSPVWGHGTATAYRQSVLKPLIDDLLAVLKDSS